MQSPGQSEILDEAQLCGDCGDEILELVGDFDHCDADFPVEAGEEWWSETTCGFCEGDLERERGAFSYAWEGTGIDNSCALCMECLNIVDSFLDTVSEDPPDGDIFVGRSGHEVKTHRDDADLKAVHETIEAVSEGERIRFEVHLPGGDKYPDLYAEGKGTIVEDNVVSALRRILVDPDDDDGSHYDIFDPLTRDWDVRGSIHRDGGRSVKEGTVTDVACLERNS